MLARDHIHGRLIAACRWRGTCTSQPDYSSRWALLAGSAGLLAQDAIQPYVEYRKRIETAQNISPLDTGLFGEQVSLYNGSTTFSVPDIDVPGHHDLPVRLTRTFSVELQPQNFLGDYDSLLRGVGNWDVDVPYMAATYNVSAGTPLRCDGVFGAAPVIEGIFNRSEVWHGISISVPGRGKTSAFSL